jgi:spore coat polysaccharide biosynthesis protein SpsF
MKLILIIFIRLNSKRLKNKGILKIGDKSIIEIIINRCLKSINKKYLIIATSKKKTDDKLINFLKTKKIKFFRGSERNVRDRTIQCCLKFKAKGFIRMNADRPFFDYKHLSKMIKIFKSGKYDIVTNKKSINRSKGLTLEIIKFDKFLNVNNRIKNSDKEHIFNYFYRNQKNYKIRYTKQLNKNISLNLALDNLNNLKLIDKIYKHFNFDYLVNTNKVIKFLKEKNGNSRNS